MINRDLKVIKDFTNPTPCEHFAALTAGKILSGYCDVKFLPSLVRWIVFVIKKNCFFTHFELFFTSRNYSSKLELNPFGLILSKIEKFSDYSNNCLQKISILLITLKNISKRLKNSLKKYTQNKYFQNTFEHILFKKRRKKYILM